MTASFDVPRFRREVLNPSLVASNEGDAFQRFVAEVLAAEYPGLHAFPGGGKDGCIDHVWPSDSPCTIFECKQIGEDGLASALARWREVAKKLSQNLADPAGPPAGQAQYQPWYRKGPPFENYIFCISSRLDNEHQRQALIGEIQGFFTGLAARHSHLRHLGGLRARILDWEDFDQRLASQPHLLFRWFPEARPHGLVPLGEEPAGSRFSEYLTDERLPYYTRREHLENHSAPPGSGIVDEAGLLASFEVAGVTGLVITGGGGFGKTRLMLELGRLARSRGWLVQRVQPRLRPDSLERLADLLRPETPALLLIDYIETQPAYGDLIEKLDLLVDERKLPLRYVSCCRSSFYPSIQLIGRHQRVDLFPQATDPADSAWLESFRESTVRHIVERTGVPSSGRVLDMCRGTPVLAVFAAWLHAQGREADLRGLLAEPDFGTWVRKRVQQSFPDPSTEERLGMFMAFFPLADSAVDILDDRQARLLDNLASDGWVERVDPGPGEEIRWEVAHDVLADQVLLSCLATRTATIRKFVRDLLEEAARLGCIGSALTALQRVGASPLLSSLPWAELITDSMERHPATWRVARLAALRSPLLNTMGKLRLLAITGSVWDGAAEEVEFHNALGWLVRAAVAGEMADSADPAVLVRWVRHVVTRVTRSNYLLTQGLRFDPQGVHEAARTWLLAHPRLLQTHYLLRSWLEAEQPVQDVQPVVREWLDTFGLAQHASYVLQSWLNAGGEKALVRDTVSSWLTEHGEKLEAEFVFKAWLDAGGEKALVRDTVSSWLAEHSEKLEAEFVFKAWLNAGGEKDLVRGAVSSWLAEHGKKLEAGFVLPPWLNAGGEKDLVRGAVSSWLAEHGEKLEAEFVFKAWLDAGGEKDLVRGTVSSWLAEHGKKLEASFVLPPWLDAGGEKDLVRGAVSSWLAKHGEELEAEFVLKSWLDAGGEKGLVRGVVLSWLAKHGEELEARFVIQPWLDAGGEKDLVQGTVSSWLAKHGEELEAQFVLKSWLDAGGERALVQSHLAEWLTIHASRSDADHVIQVWLKRGGEFALVRDSSIRWLNEHRESPEAVFITKYLARQRELPIEAVRDILIWCRTYPENSDAIWRLTSLGVHLFHPELAEDVVATSAAVAEVIIVSSLPHPNSAALANLLFAILGEDTFLRSRTKDLFLAWLRHPYSFRPARLRPDGSRSALELKAEGLPTLRYVADLIADKSLSIENDRKILARFFDWIAAWTEENRERARDFLAVLAISGNERKSSTFGIGGAMSPPDSDAGATGLP